MSFVALLLTFTALLNQKIKLGAIKNAHKPITY
jgi:hypothetical protein